MQQRGDLPFVARHHPRIRRFFMIGTPVLHPVALGEAFHLSMTEHGKHGQGGHHRTNAEVLVALPVLVYGGALVRIVHEVDVAIENLGIELDGVFEHAAVVRVLLVAQHVHKGAVVDPMHAERANKISLEQPKSLGEQKRARSLGSAPIDDFTPEFIWHSCVELGLAEAMFGARGYRPASAWNWK